jgi:hypothetical protein
MKVSGAFGEPSAAMTLRGLRQTLVEYGLVFHWALVGGAMVALGCWRRWPPRSLEWAAFTLAPLALLNVVKYVRGASDNESIRSSIDTTFTLVPYLALASALALVAAAAPHAGSRRLRAAQWLLACYVGYFAATSAAGTVVVAGWPHVAYEYAFNAQIAAALRAIPTAGSVIVTNDTRYPAAHFPERDQQLQIPAVFGHRSYFVDGVNDQFPVSAARRRRQARLREETWSPELDALARSEGWTHLLIRLDAPHAAHVPLRRLFLASEYAVYAFEGGAPGGGSVGANGIRIGAPER